MGKTVSFISILSQDIASNSHLFCGKPLIYWALSALEESKAISDVYIACENEEIKSIIHYFQFKKITFVQFFSLTNDNFWQQTLEHLQTNYNCTLEDRILFLPKVSPFLQAVDLAHIINEFQENEYNAMLSGVRIDSPIWTNIQSPKISKEQSHFIENSVFYLAKIGTVLKWNRIFSPDMPDIAIHEMPEYTLNEYEKDWGLAAFVMKKNVLATNTAPKKIRLFATDVDGVLTNAAMYYAESGDELKKFNTRDGMGLVLLRKQGIKTAIITSENTKMVENRAAKLKVDYLFQGKKYGGKLTAILEMCEKENISLEEVAYIGDDINCFDALSNVGLAACPADAEPEILAIPNIRIMTRKGGEGCVREFIRMIL